MCLLCPYYVSRATVIFMMYLASVIFSSSFSMMESCWKRKDSSRPTFSDTVSILERHLESTNDYLDLSYASANNGQTEEASAGQTMSPTEKHGSLPRIPATPNAYY